jgi:hypothetical protein
MHHGPICVYLRFNILRFATVRSMVIRSLTGEVRAVRDAGFEPQMNANGPAVAPALSNAFDPRARTARPIFLVLLTIFLTLEHNPAALLQPQRDKNP